MTNNGYLSHTFITVEFLEKHKQILKLMEDTTRELAQEGNIEDINTLMDCFRIFLQSGVGIIHAHALAQKEAKVATIN